MEDSVGDCAYLRPLPPAVSDPARPCATVEVAGRVPGSGGLWQQVLLCLHQDGYVVLVATAASGFSQTRISLTPWL